VLRTDTQYDQFSIGALMEIDGDHLAPIMSMLRHVRHDVGNMKQSILDALERIQEHLIKTGLNWAESIPSSFEELSLSPKVKTNECRLKALEFTRL